MKLNVTQKLFTTLALFVLATTTVWADGFSWSSEYRTVNGLTFHRNFTNDDPAGKTLTLIRASKNNVEHYGSTNQYGQTQGTWTSPGEGQSGEKLVGPEEYTKESYVIPAEVDGMPVVAMYGDVFTDNQYIKSVTFATANLTVVAGGSFAGSTIETLNFAGSSIKEIGLGAFANCASLKSIDNWGKVEIIHGGAFGPGSFGNCTALTEIRIGPSVKYIYGNAFGGCTNVTKLFFEDGDELLELSAGGGNEGGIYGMFYDSPISYVYYGRKQANNQHDGYAWFTNPLCLIKEEVRKTIAKMDVEIGPKVDTLRNCLFKGMDVPLFIKAPDATYIGTYAFENANLKSLDVPKIKKIDSHAFTNCLLTSLNFYSVEEIASYAFQGARLETISLPASLKYVGVNSFDDEYVDNNDQAFADANGYYPTKSCIKTLRFEDGDEPIELGFNGDEESDQFRYGLSWLKSNTLEELYIGRPVAHEPVLDEYGNTNLFSSALRFNAATLPKLKKIELTKVTMIGSAAFSAGFSDIDPKSSLEEAILPMLKVVPSKCFFNCTKLIKLSIPKALTLWDEAFAYTSAALDYSFINTVETIKSQCFAYSGIGPEVTIPGTLQFLGSKAFYNCENLKKVTFAYGEKPLAMDFFWKANYATSGCMSIGGYKCGIEQFYFDRNIEPCTYNDGSSTYTYRFEIAVSDGSYGSVGFPNLKNVTIGQNLTSLNGYSFQATGLSFIRCENPTPIVMEYDDWGEGFNADHSQGPSFSTQVQEKVKLLVPVGSVSDYLAADVWKGFLNLTDDEGDLGTIAITVPQEGITTYSGLHSLDFSTQADINAYIVSSYDIDAEIIQLSAVTDVTALKYNELGVIIKGKPGTYQVPVTTSKSAYLNMLVGTPSDQVTLNQEGYTYYNYSSSANYVYNCYLKNGQFKRSDGSAKVGPNAAYLQVPIPKYWKGQKGSNVTVTLGQSAFTPLCPEVGLNFTTVEGLEAYCATGFTNTGSVTLSRVYKVPANTVVLLKGTAGATYTIPSEKFKAVCMNMLQINPYEGEITIQERQGLTYFYLDGDKFKLAKAGTTIAPGEAYLNTLTSVVAENGPESFGIVLRETESSDVIVSREPITIAGTGKTSYCGGLSLDFSYSDEVKAYVATGFDGETIWLTRVKDVPAGTPVLIKGKANETYQVPVTDRKNSYYENMFKGNTSGATIQIGETDGNLVNYYLSGKDGTFKSVNKSVNIGNNKSYLQLPGTFEPAAPGDAQKVSIGGTGKASYAAPVDLDFTNVEGLKAFTATGYDKNGTIWLTRVMKVQKGEGMLLKGDKDKEYTIPSVAVQSSYKNMFVGNISGETKTIGERSADGLWTYYYLSGKDGTFKSVNKSVNIGDKKSYLQLPTSYVSTAATTRGIEDCLFEEEPEVIAIPVVIRRLAEATTGIKANSQKLNANSQESNSQYYNLQGQRVDNPGKGLYIKNGKKVVIQ